MKTSLALSLLFAGSVSAFAPQPFVRNKSVLHSAAPSDVESLESEAASEPLAPGSDALLSTRNDLLSTTLKLVSDSATGVFITAPADRAEFIKAVARLEAVCPTTSDESEPLCLGDWTLLATTKRTPVGKSLDDRLDTSDENVKKFKLPMTDLSSKLQESITVTQRIRCSNMAAGPIVDRVDNIIEFDNTQTNILPSFLNPLQLEKSKTVLIHDAKVESFVPFRTKISLKSVVFNLAGQSKQLDPEGADVLGLNIPSLSDWMNAGNFDTTYVDENVRISRGKTGIFEETRVFVKQGYDLDAWKDGNGVVSAEEKEDENNKLDKIRSAVGNVATAVEDLGNDVKQTIEKDAEFVKDDIEKVVKDVREVIEEDLKDVGEAVEKVKSAIIDDEEIEEAVDNVTSLVGDVVKDITEDRKKLQDAVVGVGNVIRSKTSEGEESAEESAEEEGSVEDDEKKGDDSTDEEDEDEEKEDDSTDEKNEDEDTKDDK